MSLKFLNRFLRYNKFEMTTIKVIKTWIRNGHYFTSIALTDAFFSIPLHPSAGTLTCFLWRGVTYKFVVIMFGLEANPRDFTKIS